MGPAEMELVLHPKCNACKIAQAKATFQKGIKRPN